ncbi:TAT-variant-translocated molybdopterin oxidoreductase [Planctomycetales bacterium ZRK34]|nr:TAT-variant-translocated molybdopterin oxidoreductase [Planctomycetales bacterium ZRK34]
MPSVKPKQNSTGPAYWRSLDELADTPRFRAFLEKEFADYDPEQILAVPSRRGFMKLMAASMALAGAASLTGCRRWPEQHVAPYNNRPEGFTPGAAVQFATVMELGGVAQPLLATSIDGRPVKIEGNPTHPLSGGAAGRLAQASVLEMFDPERSREILSQGKKSTWDAFATGVGSFKGGAGLTVLSEATSSPSVAALRKQLGEADWYEYEPINRDNALEGARHAFGKSLREQLHLDKAQVIACFDADILGSHPAAIRHARDWAAGRDVEHGDFKRVYMTEGVFSITGANADERVPVPTGMVLEVLKAVAAALGINQSPSVELSAPARQWVDKLAADLKAHKGASLVTVGPNQPAVAHVLGAMINDALGNLGKTVTYIEEPGGDRPTSTAAISALVRKINAGEVKTLLILGGNPVFNAPMDLKFGDALKKVDTSIHLSHYVDETSKACTWHLPRAHYLEAWGDARAWDGSLSVVQPLIQPLYDDANSIPKSVIEVLAMLAGDKVADGREIVRRTFGEILPKSSFERAWQTVLRDGTVVGSATPAEKVAKPSEKSMAMIAATVAGQGYELTFTEDYTVYDGRFANNGWLQETPDPMTKVVWDNPANMSPNTAKDLKVWQDDLIEIAVGQHTMTAAVNLLPGMADGAIGISLGYGRTSAGYVGDKVGFDVYQARSSTQMGFAPVSVKKTNRRYRVVATQEHFAIDSTAAQEREERSSYELYRSATVGQYKEYEHHAAEHGGHGDHEFSLRKLPHVPSMKDKQGHTVPLQIFDEAVDYSKEKHAWAMAIDLSKCIGCNACVVACQSENNVPVVGKYECGRGREMAWIRVDRYFHGDPDHSESIKAVHQVVTCHHCENAPCEQVCPVAATTHDSEGLNVMIYNRCIGTRYCSNNCPYKVRRFNWFDWHAKPVHSSIFGGTWLGIPDQQQLSIDKIRQMQFNPEVTVRMRGVMEKCSFCVQRIKAATIPAKNADPNYQLEDGTINPACAQTCATDAIIFGDLADSNSRVSKAFKNPRAFEMLKHLNVRARTRYLARINNPVEATADHGSGHDAGHGSESPKEPSHAKDHG